MRWAVILLGFSPFVLSAQQPDDIRFELRLKKDPPQYATYEPIEFEVSLSSSSRDKYMASWTGLAPVGGPTVVLEPRVGAVDPQSFYSGLEMGSILSSSGSLSPKPVTESGDLTQWYRFEKPGHFRFSLKTNWVKGLPDLESNEVEFDIAAPDPALQAEALQSVLSEIDSAKAGGDKQEALHRLSLIQTPQATEEEVRRYLADVPGQWNGFYSLLLESSNPEEIIPSLEAALANPEMNVPEGTVELLTSLQVRKQLGTEGNASERAKLHDKLLAQNAALLLKGLRSRSGSQRLDALFETWTQMERLQAGDDPPPEALTLLRSEVLDASGQMSFIRQSQLLDMGWDKIPHRDLLPVIRRLALADHWRPGISDEAARHWCEDWAADCMQGILTQARKPNTQMELETIFLLPEAEHPELDATLLQKLSHREESQTAAALMSRVASKSIAPDVEAFLDQPTPGIRDCGTDGYLLAYLLRVAPVKGIKRISSFLRNPPEPACGSFVLHSLRHLSNVEPAIPAVIAAVNSSDSGTAGAAALFLAARGPATARPIILKRLEAFREQWRGHNLEMDPAAQLENDLVSALVHSEKWQASADEQDFLAAGCLSEQCRDFAYDKSYSSF